MPEDEGGVWRKLPRNGLDTEVVAVEEVVAGEVEEKKVEEERRGVSLGTREPCGLS